jgi:dihydroorotate dehydrogenase
MDVDKLASWNGKFYSVVEGVPERFQDYAIQISRQFLRLPIERLADCKFDYENLRTVLRGPEGSTGLELESPVTLAAGYSESHILERALRLGYAAVTAKCSKEPMEGNKGRKIIRTSEGPENSIGYKNPGMKALRPKLERIRKRTGEKKRIIVNISDSSVENYCEVIGYMDPVADAFEIGNCLNAPKGKRLDFFHDDDLARYLFRSTRSCTKKPLILKCARREDVPNLFRTCGIAVDNGYTILNYANTKRVVNAKFLTGEGARSGPGLYSDTLDGSFSLNLEFGNYADIMATGGIYIPYQAYEVMERGGAKAFAHLTGFPPNIFFAIQTNRDLSSRRSSLSLK